MEFADNGDAPAPQGGGNGQFQEVNGVIGCIHGGASLPPSNSAGKRLVRELNTVAPAPLKPLEWSNQVISFDTEDHPDNTVGVGTLPLVVSPIIHNFKVTKMLVDEAPASIC